MNRANVLCFLLFVNFAFEVYSNSPIGNVPSSSHFQCKTGKLRYVYDRWFCDEIEDCDDGSDEGYGCDREACGCGKFKCTEGTCLNITKHCDTNKDCTDGSDELNCGEQIDVKSCLSRDDKFVCDNKKQCIDEQYVCDKFCNCEDCSDEKASGCSRYDDYLCDKCSGACYSKETNGTLGTPPKSQNTSSGVCKLCLTGSHCHQKCLSIENQRERCICDEHYYPGGRPTTPPDENELYWRVILPDDNCISSVPYENVVIYSTSNEVKLFNFTTNETTTLRAGVDCTAISAAHDDVFCATFSNNTAVILKISITTKQSTELIKLDSLVLSIAIDWMTNNIYYTTNSSLMVCTSSGKTCSKLLFCPQCVVRVAPKRGLMFLFTKKDNHIMQAAMDGSNQRRIGDLSYTNGSEYYFNVSHTFTIDESKDRILWSETMTDGYTKFVWSRFYTSSPNMKMYVFPADELNLIDFDEIEDILYYTSKNQNVIYFKNLLFTDSFPSRRRVTAGISVKDVHATEIKYIRVYNRLLQRTKVPNPCAKTSCSLCLLRPTTTPLRGLDYTCKCNNITSMDDRFSC